MPSNQVIALIEEQFNKISQNPALSLPVQELEPPDSVLENQMIVFLKPETAAIPAIWELVLERLAVFGYSVSALRVLSGENMKEQRIPQRHYGVINTVSERGAAALSEEAKSAFQKTWGLTPEQASVLGGIEAINEKGWTLEEVNQLWAGADPDVYGTPDGVVKLGGGTYGLKIVHNGQTFYLLNGFQPQQISHFASSPDRRVVVFLCRRNPNGASWRQIRRSFLGSTDPSKAAPDSIRGILYRGAASFGITGVNISQNGIHGSAGPLEGLREIEIWLQYPIARTAFGNSLLIKNYTEMEIKTLLDNPALTVEGKQTPLFDLTEEMDAWECMSFITAYLPPRCSK